MIIDSLSTNSLPSHIIVKYQFSDGIPAGSDSTSLLELELPGLYTSESSYRSEPRIILTSKSYAIDLLQISISCISSNYSVKLLNKNDIDLGDTIYEVLSYSNINKSVSDIFNKFIIRNRDVVLDNKLYLYISNNDSVDIEDIEVELVYITLQDRTF